MNRKSVKITVGTACNFILYTLLPQSCNKCSCIANGLLSRSERIIIIYGVVNANIFIIRQDSILLPALRANEGTDGHEVLLSHSCALSLYTTRTDHLPECLIAILYYKCLLCYSNHNLCPSTSSAKLESFTINTSHDSSDN